ncbi:sodium:solute symporter [Povalibacter sp.]|uniref:sodium:solute symporter n=1 Tax=Povalibacter sp. TaxID=1962978 RepID=UPI002F3F11A4
MDLLVIALYMLGMIGIGWYAKSRARTQSDFLVAGRRLGPVFYAGTLAALVMGGGATLGGIGLGYEHGLSGVWLVFSMSAGVAVISLVLAPLINRLRVYTVSQMLELRYGAMGTRVSGIVMMAYTLMIAVTSTIAYGAIFSVLFDIGKVPAIMIGSSVVITYSVLGGMWSITFTDMVQFVLKSVSIFLILLPMALFSAGGLEGLHARLPAEAFNWTEIGPGKIFMYLLLYVPTMVIGQDLWQRVFTARTDAVARWAGFSAACYGFAYGVAGALIGMSAKVLLPGLVGRDAVYTEIVRHVLPVGLAGLVVAGALSAIMSTSSGALIATATVAKEDVQGKRSTGDGHYDEIRNTRVYIAFFGITMAVIACLVKDVVTALTLASDFLVGGLLVAVIGGMIWRRGTARGAIASIFAGLIGTLGTMAILWDVFATLPIFVGITCSLVSYVVVSLLDQPTSPAVLARWDERVRAKSAAPASPEDLAVERAPS